MKICPKCHNQVGVADSRIMPDNNTRRRYRCSCGKNWSTIEVLVSEYKSGDRSAYDRLEADINKKNGWLSRDKLKAALADFVKELDI